MRRRLNPAYIGELRNPVVDAAHTSLAVQVRPSCAPSAAGRRF